jgi:hypothetical protein
MIGILLRHYTVLPGSTPRVRCSSWCLRSCRASASRSAIPSHLPTGSFVASLFIFDNPHFQDCYFFNFLCVLKVSHIQQKSTGRRKVH